MTTAQKTLGINNTDVIVLWPENKKRTYLLVQNQSTLTIVISYAATPTSVFGYKIAAGDEYAPVNPPTGEVRVIGTDIVNRQTIYTAEETT